MTQRQQLSTTYFSILLILFVIGQVCAQNPLALNQLEQAFQKNNLQLLAAQYNITASRAAVIQARIWDQPYLSTDVNLINPSAGRLFDIGSNGEKGLAIQQLIYRGGKKKSEVNFAKSNVELAELQFEQLVRSLKYALDQDYYSIYFDQKKIATLDGQIGRLDSLLISYQNQSAINNIPLNQVVRLQSLILSLRTDRNEIQKNITEAHQDLLLISGLTTPVLPIVDEAALKLKYTGLHVSQDSLAGIAYQYNPDYLFNLKIIQNQELYLQWQKSLAVPDLTAGLTYDQGGGAFRNQINLTFGIPLPVWNRNKGNILAAEALRDQASTYAAFKKIELKNKIEAAILIWQQYLNQYNSITPAVTINQETVYQGILANFQKRNISLLEFTDFMESHNQTILQLNEIKKQWVLSGLTINYLINHDVF
jgi:cobalt-zinc-cadmium efflux system outer membrane protein